MLQFSLMSARVPWRGAAPPVEQQVTSAARDVEVLRAAVTRELLDLTEDVKWTEKAHFALAEDRARVNLLLGLGSTTSAAIAAATVVADVAPAITGACALIAAITSGLLTFLKPRDAEIRHLSAGRQLGALRVAIRQTLRIDLAAAAQSDPQSWRETARKFAQEKARVDLESPGTSSRAFRVARRKIGAGHFDHETDG